MKSLLITAPILPGKLEAWRRTVDLLLNEKIEAYHDAIREGGLSRLRVWHQPIPGGGDLAVVLYEGPAPERFLGRIATSHDEFSVWFKQGLAEAHGLDFSQPMPPPPELVIDERPAPERAVARA